MARLRQVHEERRRDISVSPPLEPADHAVEAAREPGPAAFAVRPVAAICLGLAAVLTALSGRYGFHRDELYFVAAGNRLDWGYVDQPPLTPLLARVSTTLFGDTPAGLRVVATLLTVAIVVVAALVARELGGGRGAQTLTAATVATSSVIVTTGHMLATATVDTLIWLVLCLLVLRLARTGDGRWYLAIGATAGIGVLNKYLVLLLLAALLVSIAAVGPRRVLCTWWLAAGALIACAIAAPTVIWQAAHGWPQLTIASAINDQNGVENRVLFVPFQLVYTAPLYAPIWLAGLVRLFRDPQVRWARAFAVAYLLLAALMLVAAGKPYYVIGLLVVMMAAGAEPALRWARRIGRPWLLPATVVVVAVVYTAATLPVWPRTALNPVNAMNKEQGEQVGWPELAGQVATAWREIPEADRGRAVIFTQNYGEAAAIDRYARADGLPRAYSGHMSYADWGTPPDSATGPVLLVRFPANEKLARQFTGCRVVRRVDNGYGVHNPEQGSLVELCQGPRLPWSALWHELRHTY
ncbi:MAG TPA: glycosyltransferase family 39 protein [Actinophytocola sp.]|uniref:ArnT family glycosyltransferase n=1 Tax=Actinophytocola sp. TaxID=1872138 RepID=UPI002F91CBC4